MQKYVCKVCGHVYDPAENNNVAFEDLPDDWVCPLCGVGKDQFEETFWKTLAGRTVGSFSVSSKFGVQVTVSRSMSSRSSWLMAARRASV